MSNLYKPKFLSTLIVAGLVLCFYIVLGTIRQTLSQTELVACIVIFTILILIELLVFARGVIFGSESMKLFNGLQYILHLRPVEIPYRDIKEINEMDTPRRKFANLKIVTTEKIYMIPVTGISHYKKMKAELETHIIGKVQNNSK